MGRVQKRPVLAAFVVLAAACAAVRADVVLLDEYWTPEILNNEVGVTEVDTRDTGDPLQAKFGEFSALLENETGWPNVRFRGAPRITAAELSPDYTEASLWYRTDAWTGTWRMEVWMWSNAHRAVVKILEGVLNGGAAGGGLIADDEWHQASGILSATDDYELAASQRIGQSSYVWLVPIDGWDIPHRTYVDRIELTIVGGPLQGLYPAPEAARHVRPDPGAQTAGDGWVWWEGENAVTHNFPPGGAFRPDNAKVQADLSNGDWLQDYRLADHTAEWKVTLAEDGPYAFWSRGFWTRGEFDWRWDDGEWQTCAPDRERVDKVFLVDEWISAGWVDLGQVGLAEGEHALQVKFPPDAVGACFDCWLLTKVPFTPKGHLKPGEEEEP
jgi:hypothetical protein